MANTPIKDLDFDDIKKSLKDYLRSQDTFKDYDYEGSTMNILLDLLAYNTHYQAYYANMVANESFLDSAVDRNSVVSLAKHLNYMPRSKRASRIGVNVVYVPTTQADRNTAINRGKFLPRGTQFTAKGPTGKTVTFVTLEDYRFEVLNSQIVARNVMLYEGSIKFRSFVYDAKNPENRILIDDIDADMETLIVNVQKSLSDSTGAADVWKKAEDVVSINGSSSVYFLQEYRDKKWQIYFGDGVIGRLVTDGSLVSTSFLSTSGPNANGVGSTDTTANRAFTCLLGSQYTTQVITDDAGVPQASFGGELRETLDSIKYYAPRNFQAQDRAVTADDYLAILAKEYSLRSESFLVWGGEENDPPQYGKVFISIKPKNAAKLTITEKQSITNNILAGRNLLTVTPTVVDPDLTYINPTIEVRYDPIKTSMSPESLASYVRSKTLDFSTSNLDKFGSNFRLSKFTATIDALNDSFNSTTINFYLEKRIEPQFNRTLPYTIKFDNPIKHPIDGYTPVLSSSSFYYLDLTSSLVSKPTVEAFFDDDGYGKVRIYKLVNGNKSYLTNNIGTIDYSTGTIVIKNFSPLGILDGSTTIKLRIEPNSGDIYVRRNQILLMNPEVIDVYMVQEKTVIDRKASDTGFPFRI